MKKLFLTSVLCLFGLSVLAQKQIDSLAKYRRSSLYSVLIKHSALPYGETIDSAFMAIPIPDKFNNHDLAVKSFESSAKKVKKAAKNDKKDAVNLADITTFINENSIPKELIAKWFNRDADGYFNMDLIAERGNYDASQVDIVQAEQSARGLAMLQDAGQELIGKTFMLVNDITFIDHGENSKKATGWIRLAGSIAGAATGQDLSKVTEMTASAVNEIDGFKVNITSYLYRLVWNDDILNQFYNDYYTDRSYPAETHATNKAKFDNLPADNELFRLEYVGQTTSSAANLSSKSLAKKSKSEQMLKVCTRAIDKAIVELQREYEEFKVNVPIYAINEDGTVDVQIGLKEGINEKSQFDVLMPAEDENGRTYYEKIGKLEPIEGKIWDNRFGALEDAQALADDAEAKNDEESKLGNASLKATTFKVLSGANRIVPGCLVREVTIKRNK